MVIHFFLTKDFLRGGGIETYTREVSRRLVDRGHDVVVYSTRGSSETPSSWNGVSLRWIPQVKPYWAEKFSGAALAAWHVLSNKAPDILHLHSVAAGALAPLLRYKGPCLVQMHGIEWQRARWSRFAKSVLHNMERISVRAANSLTAVSKSQCEYFRTQYGARCEFIPTAAEMRDYAAPHLITRLGLTPKRYILFAARLVPEKGAHHLIKAFRQSSTDMRLAIAGDAPANGAYRQELHQMAAGDNRICFLGRAEGRLLDELFSHAALFAQPSELEGLSIGLIEAMSCGLPCLSSDIPENREVVGNCAILFRNKDAADLAVQLDAALSNPAKAADLARMGRQRAYSLFTWDSVVDRLQNCYTRLLLGKNTEVEPVLSPATEPLGAADVI